MGNRQRRDSLLRAKLRAEEEAAAASAEAAAAAESSMAEVDELRKKKEREHEERKREIEMALEQSRQDHARQEAESTRIREEFKAQEAERERLVSWGLLVDGGLATIMCIQMLQVVLTTRISKLGARA